MTGEITLRGKVLPVGGIKEKLLAAHRQGITDIIISADNEKELEEIPANIRKNLKIHKVKTADEVLKLALVGKPKRAPLKFTRRAMGTEAKKQNQKAAEE
jgi:ATP-dependent Lon protease